MKHLLKRLFGWCPQPRNPNYRVLRQYSKPILSLAMFGVLVISIFAVSTFAISHTLPPIIPVAPTETPTPTPTATPNIQPTATSKPSVSPTPIPTFYPNSSPIPTPNPIVIPTYKVPNGTVDFQGVVGAYSSLVLDSSSNPHISYFDSSHGALKYAIWNGVWNSQTVDATTAVGASSASVGTYSSLALDSKGYPHISYINYTNFNTGYLTINSSLVFGDLKYAWWDGTSWKNQTVDFGVGGYVDSYCSLAIDSSGKPHILYYSSNGSNGNLRYASWTGSSWTTETVDSKGTTGFSSLTMDSAGNPYITYFDSNGNLKYATKTNTGWNLQIVDYSVVIHSWGGSNCRIILDSNGIPHIGYWKEANSDSSNGLMYAFWNGTGWNIETVDTVNVVGYGSVGGWSSLALDSNGYPHISYVDQNSYAALKYAWWNGTAWNKAILDTMNVGFYSSLAIDSSGKSHISYMDEYQLDLKYISIR
jgi:hypothetical protein